MRRRIFLAFASIVVGILVILVGTVFTVTRTSWGRRQLAQYVVRTLHSAFPGGTVYLGTLGGNLFTGLTLDSLEVRDRNDSLFLALGRVEVSYDPRDLLERRILLHRVRLGSLTAHLFEDSAGTFNFRRIFDSGQPVEPKPPEPPEVGPRRGWGHFIRVEDAIVGSANVTLTTRWTPSDLLSPTERDSVIRFNLGREDKEIRQGSGAYFETRRWTDGHIELDSARIDDNQSGGRRFAIRSLAVDENDPPFRFRNARGELRIQGDSIFADVPQFALPDSRGSMRGKIWWGAGQPTRFDLAIRSDSVAIRDIAWIYPTLPRTGSGRMDLVIRSQADPRLIDYVISNMDVRSTDSRLRGAMTFGVGAPVTIVKDVDLTLQPLDFRLIETLAGEPLPYPWRGTLTGTVLASGGPLDNWMVDEADVVFRDANVPGAVTVARARGRMNILEPSEVVFNGLGVDLDQLDLRTLQYLVPDFPRLNGQIAGHAVLDSLWTDVRFREADLTHTDGSGPATRMVGAGRVTFAEAYTAYDVALTAQPFSFTTFSRAYQDSHIPLKGEYEGPLRLFGTTQDLAVTTQLRGPAGLIGYDGRVDGDSLGGYGLDGVLSFAQLDLRTLLDTAITPPTDLWGLATLNVAFDSLPTLRGSATVELDRHSRIDSVVVYDGSRMRMRFEDGIAQVLPGDTVRYGAGQVVASGGIGLGAGFSDTLVVDVRLDTLGGLRPYLDVAPDDTLGGSATARLALTGSLDTLGISGWLVANAIVMPGLKVDSLRVTPALTNVTGAIGGRVDFGGASPVLGGVRFTTVTGDVELQEGQLGNYGVYAEALNGPRISSQGALRFEGDTTTVRVDSLALALPAPPTAAGAPDEHRYRLSRPATVRVEPERVRVDSLVLVGPDDTRLIFAADAPDRATMNAQVGVERLSLKDLSQVFQTELALDGRLTASLEVTGTRDQPSLTASATLSDVAAGDVSVAQVTMSGTYSDRRLLGSARITQSDTTVLSVFANLPVNLAIRSMDSRWVEDTMRVSVRSPDVDMAILETFTPAVRSASGILSANLDLAGPRGAAELNGSITVTGGRATLPAMGITLRDTYARISARNDTLRVDSLFLVSGPQDDDYLTVSGFVAHPLDTSRVSFELAARADEFHAIGLERQIADLTVDASVRWSGTNDASRASGIVVVQEGTIALPATSDKDLFVIDNWRELGIDSLEVGRLGLVPKPAARLIRGLSAEEVQIAMGPDVWLRADDAAIKLAGAVNLTVTPDSATGETQPALTGELQTERGTYTLNVSPFQRTFFVESGRLRFTGQKGFNPELDIRAIYTSRVIETNYGGRNDVRVGAHITGSLLSPSLYLYSADSLGFLAEPDLWSYVLFNQPSFAVGGGRRDADFAVSLLLGTASAYASSLASRYAGGIVDYVQLQTSAANPFGGGPFGIGPLQGAQLGIGRQIGDRYFISATSGLCQLLGQSQSSASWAESVGASLGAKVEVRFGANSPAGLSAAYEPSFGNVVCTTSGNIGFTSARKQAGLDIFRVWRR